MEVTALCGLGTAFAYQIDAPLRCLVTTVDATEEMLHVANRLVAEFGLTDVAHRAELWARLDRRAAPGDEAAGPRSGLQVRTPLYRDTTAAGAAEVRIGDFLGRGDVVYLRFDFAAEWWWRVRIIDTGTGVSMETLLPAYTFDQRPDRGGGARASLRGARGPLPGPAQRVR